MDVWDYYIHLSNIQKNNRLLEKEIKRLNSNAVKYEELKLAFRRLSKMLDYKMKSKREMVIASIIGADSTSWSKILTIDRGADDGIKKNMAVITHEGLVGHVIEAVAGSSKVLLITDARSAVDALEQKNRTRGVVVGKGVDFCEMKYLSRDADIQIGHSVISSGLGGLFPKGLLIGTVSNIGDSEKGLFKNVTITPAAKISFLEEVYVLK